MKHQFKLKVNDVFAMGRVDCVISVCDYFGATPHYGFTYRTDTGDFQSGWMPAYFVENFTGHYVKNLNSAGTKVN